MSSKLKKIKTYFFFFILCALFILFTGCADMESIDDNSTTSTDKIIGGKVSKDHPAVVGLMFKKSISCTGTLITKRSVLTAAHCLVVNNRNRTIINEPNSVVFTKGKKRIQKIRVVGSNIHPNYDADNLINDLAILYLAEESQQEPMKIYTEDPSLLNNGEATIVGFGETKRGSYGVKRRAQMRFIGNDDDYVYVQSPNKKHRSSCYGDSGGPVLVDSRSTTYIAGVLSYGSTIKCRRGDISFYSRVDNRLDWIINHHNP